MPYENARVHKMLELIEPLAVDPNVPDEQWQKALLEYACTLDARAIEFSEAKLHLQARRMVAQDRAADAAGKVDAA